MNRQEETVVMSGPMTRRRLAVLGSSVAGASWLAACGGAGGSSANPVPAARQVTLVH